MSHCLTHQFLAVVDLVKVVKISMSLLCWPNFTEQLKYFHKLNISCKQFK